MGYTPGDIVPRDGEVYCKEHPEIRAHVKEGERFPPPSHHKGEHCEWEYKR
ncbi:MAG: hypothetical protein ACXVAC_10190 [Vulcanimicrobiaceae bacterium]